MRLKRIADSLGRMYGIAGQVTHCSWSLYELKDGSFALTAVPNA